ncbi:MAG: hypothetical protein R3246_10340, partial [Acidimicrobiia bacterium]|nr:hypothetical protein [Acidimicrobiia bacterium]
MILAQTALTLPDVSWLAIAPEVVLGVGAALVLLLDVQFRPAIRRLGQAVAAILAVAFGFTVWQWIRVEDLEASPTPDFIAQILPFGRMIVLDHGAVFARFAVLVAAALGVAAGWKLFERLGRRGAEALALVLLATAGFMLMAAST